MNEIPNPFDLKKLIRERQAGAPELFREYVNPKLHQALNIIGFNRRYVRGQGAYLWDEEGRRYLDLLSGYGMFNLGRNHPQIKQAVRDYLDLDDPWKIQMGETVLPGILAQELIRRIPHLNKVHFTSSGTESVEAALKFARAATGRQVVLHAERSFHGLTYGSLSVNGCPSFRQGFGELIPGAVSAPFGDLDALKRRIQEWTPAALILEPVQGKGVYRATAEYLLGAQDICRRHGVIFIIDEIQTGMGRTGKLFAYQHVEGLEPDIVAVAKSLSGGMVPAGAVIMRDRIYQKVYSSLDRCVVHSSTFGQGGLAMACGLATLHILEAENLIDNAVRFGSALEEGLRAMIPKYELLREIRASGLMIGIELGAPKSLGLRSAWTMIHAADKGLFPQAIIMPLLEEHGILTQVAGHHMDVIKLLPPLTLQESDVEWFLNAFEETLARCHKFPGPAWSTAKHLIRFAAQDKMAKKASLSEPHRA